MTIGIDARFLGSKTGFDRYLQGLLETLEVNNSDHRYIIFVSKQGDAVYTPRHPNLKKIVIDYPWYGFKEQFLGFRFKREKVDLMHIPSWNAPWWMPTAFVVTIHDLILWEKPDPAGTHLPTWFFYLKYWLFKKIFARAVRKSRKILVPSAYTAQELKNAFPDIAKKIIITGEAIKDFSRLDGDQKFLEKNNIKLPYLLYVGSAYPHKNLKRLLLAFTMFRVKHKEYTLVLAGNQDAFYNDLKLWAKEKRLFFGIQFVGGVGDSELATLYREAALLLYVSLTEGYGLPPLEALTVGTRSVVSDRGSLPEVLGNQATYADPLNIQDIQAKIEVGLSLPKIDIKKTPPASRHFGEIMRASYDNVLKN